jgi:deoxyribodipyrimidine photo-lyase
MSAASIVWYRQDLRLRDNPALSAACERGLPVIPLYIWSPAEEGAWPPGAASCWWLHHSLRELDQSLRQHGLRLIIRRGPALQVLRAVIAETHATAVYWNRRYEPAARACSGHIRRTLSGDGLDARSFNGALLTDPREILSQGAKPYRLYTPYLRAILRGPEQPPALGIPRVWPPPSHWPASEALEALELMPKTPWYASLQAAWHPGESGALARLKTFLDERLGVYERTRDAPALRGTSGLSPHLHFGEIGPRQIWHALGAQARHSVFLREIVWREFGYYLLYHFPHTTQEPLRPEFANFPWQENPVWLAAWQSGRTGVPMVDAGMRELWSTGVMHNRVRMITASFLVKNLLLPWQQGARWFWDTLVDADLASNTLNWQWVAGSGADAAPYFRIFNPVLQGQRFDRQGDYIRRWIAPLAACGDKQVHTPWLDGATAVSYPPPIVDLAASRLAALAAYRDMRNAAALPKVG